MLRRTGIAAARADRVRRSPCWPGAAAAAGSEESAPDLLARAKTTLDEASSAHFVLDSEGAPDSGTLLVGGEGDIARPASFEGTLKVRALGSALDLEVISVDGTVYAQLPFTSGFSVVDPAHVRLRRPGRAARPRHRHLPAAGRGGLGPSWGRRAGSTARWSARSPPNSPATSWSRSSPAQDPSQPVQARFSIATETGELRRAELTGPFFTAGEDATYTLELSDFGADVEITAPPTG